MIILFSGDPNQDPNAGFNQGPHHAQNNVSSEIIQLQLNYQKLFYQIKNYQFQAQMDGINYNNQGVDMCDPGPCDDMGMCPPAPGQ